jgi:2-C-methyl-D-erythritol 2,4-cyclodiphosphate synthase
MLGGVEIPHDRGLDGHSDADALLHAICDALLGAAGCGDIGQHFPSSDPAWKDASSLKLLRRVRQVVAQAGYQVGNVDAVVIAQEPRIEPHRERMRGTIATALGVSPSAVNVKATTNERLGAIGRGEGIAAYAVALLVR